MSTRAPSTSRSSRSPQSLRRLVTSNYEKFLALPDGLVKKCLEGPSLKIRPILGRPYVISPRLTNDEVILSFFGSTRSLELYTKLDLKAPNLL